MNGNSEALATVHDHRHPLLAAATTADESFRFAFHLIQPHSPTTLERDERYTRVSVLSSHA